MELASGFSQTMCLPASAAASTISQCMWPGVETSTMSMSSRATTARQSLDASFQPNASRACSVSSGLRPQITTRSTLGASAKYMLTLRYAWL